MVRLSGVEPPTSGATMKRFQIRPLPAPSPNQLTSVENPRHHFHNLLDLLGIVNN